MVSDRPLPIPSSADLAKRLNIALDYWEVTRGEALTFPEVQSFLEDRGISLSRSRWGYMTRGEGWRVRDRRLLAVLAELFGVPEAYFYTGKMTEAMLAELSLVKAMRAAKVQNYAARVLGDLAPEALSAIAAALHEIEAEDDE